MLAEFKGRNYKEDFWKKAAVQDALRTGETQTCSLQF